MAAFSSASGFSSFWEGECGVCVYPILCVHGFLILVAVSPVSPSFLPFFYSKREIDIAFDLNIDFEATNVVMQSASLSSGSGQANIASFVKACKCNNLESFKCNTN